MRDFTYIDDIIKSLELTLSNKSNNRNLYKIYNIGNNTPVKLLDLIKEIEITTGLKSKLKLPIASAWRCSSNMGIYKCVYEDYGFQPKTPLKTGLNTFYHWYKSYYK